MRHLICATMLMQFGVSGLKNRATAEERLFPEIERRLIPHSTKLGKPKPGEWLYEHKERGQSFSRYLAARPIRRTKERSTIYLCLIGEFTRKQQLVLDLTRDYMSIFFDVPVKIHKKVAVKDIPKSAKRKHPQWGDKQILTDHVLNKILLPSRPKDALAYLAFTSSDLWPGKGWNFVFGEASLRQRIGVWSIYRNGDPVKNFQQYLRRTLSTATHETGHILTMEHCIVYECSQNGSNSLPESDRKPLHLCPTCLRKLCWNLQVNPKSYLTRLKKFCEKHKLEEEVKWYQLALKTLSSKR